MCAKDTNFTTGRRDSLLVNRRNKCLYVISSPVKSSVKDHNVPTQGPLSPSGLFWYRCSCNHTTASILFSLVFPPWCIAMCVLHFSPSLANFTLLKTLPVFPVFNSWWSQITDPLPLCPYSHSGSFCFPTCLEDLTLIHSCWFWVLCKTKRETQDSDNIIWFHSEDHSSAVCNRKIGR